MLRLLQLVICCAVNGENKDDHIQAILSMEREVQQAIMESVQEVGLSWLYMCVLFLATCIWPIHITCVLFESNHECFCILIGPFYYLLLSIFTLYSFILSSKCWVVTKLTNIRIIISYRWWMKHRVKAMMSLWLVK